MTNNQNFYITNQEQLQRVIDLIRAKKLVAIDTEFTRQTTYYPILSIIQIAVKNSAGKKESFIIDCLADLDLSEFFAIMGDPEIIKILHSSMQDLQIFNHKSGLVPHGVVDTQVMANFCGFGFNVGYSSLVEKLFNEQLDKKEQRSDWQKRPLSKKQIEYALLDVLFLEEIYEKFFEILTQRNQVDWYFEEMKNFVNKILSKSEENLTKNFTFKHKSTDQVAQIKNLISWRESWAQKIDIPRQHFLRDEEIESIVIKQKVDFDFDRKMIKEIEEILERKNEIAAANLSNSERRFFMGEKQKNCYQEAKKLISKISAAENFKEQFLITSSDLQKAICEQRLFNEIVSGWRYQLFGKELEQLIFNT